MIKMSRAHHFTRKEAAVTAIQFTGNNRKECESFVSPSKINTLAGCAGGDKQFGFVGGFVGGRAMRLLVADVGDWIVFLCSDRSFSVCNANEFRRKYERPVKEPVEPSPPPADNERGLYEKFAVTRTDGRSGPGEKHERCEYFVLDLSHDPYARPALVAYANSCVEALPQLAADLMTRMTGVSQLRFAPSPIGRGEDDFERYETCPECRSYDVSEYHHKDDFSSFKCNSCNYIGDPGEEFESVGKVKLLMERLEAKLKKANATIEHQQQEIGKLQAPAPSEDGEKLGDEIGATTSPSRNSRRAFPSKQAALDYIEHVGLSMAMHKEFNGHAWTSHPTLTLGDLRGFAAVIKARKALSEAGQ